MGFKEDEVNPNCWPLCSLCVLWQSTGVSKKMKLILTVGLFVAFVCCGRVQRQETSIDDFLQKERHRSKIVKAVEKDVAVAEVLKDDRDRDVRMNADVNPKDREVQNDRAATRVLTNDFSPCTNQKFEGYYCNVETKKSFGCGFGLRSLCWRSCDAATEANCKNYYDWCAVDVGTCTYDKNCEVGVYAPCWY